MTYQLETSSQTYGDREFLTHNLKGTTTADDRYLFAQRVPSYGVINFGAMAAGSTKDFSLIDNGINGEILVRSIYDFTNFSTNDEVAFRLLQGTTQILEQRITSNEMPYTFPPGAILNPSLTIQVEPRYTTTQLLIYWQPVHILSYIEVL